MKNKTSCRDISVRKGQIADADTIADFNFAMAKETEDLMLNRDRLAQGVVSMLKDSGKGFYVVAECDGKVVGQAMITYEWSDWRNATFWWIQSVYVLPEYRRTGVFRSLYEHIKSMAESASDVCGLKLYVDSGNHRAKQVYRNLGMESSHYELYETMIECSV